MKQLFSKTSTLKSSRAWGCRIWNGKMMSWCTSSRNQNISFENRLKFVQPKDAFRLHCKKVGKNFDFEVPTFFFFWWTCILFWLNWRSKLFDASKGSWWKHIEVTSNFSTSTTKLDDGISFLTFTFHSRWVLKNYEERKNGNACQVGKFFSKYQQLQELLKGVDPSWFFPYFHMLCYYFYILSWR